MYNLYRNGIKRFGDLFFAISALLFICPIFLILIIWLYFSNKGAGVFFTQERPGKDEKIFKVIKFKSMTDECDATGKLLPDQQRLTAVGRFIRSTSLDELPQLFNIIKGDMSLIGPRPLAVKYLPYYNEIEKHRHDVRPGITGLAQINGRKSINWEQKLDYDIEYVNNLSFSLDLKIFFRTILKVIKREDVGIESSGIVNFHEWRMKQLQNENKNQRNRE